jgi:hypothetical protein
MVETQYSAVVGISRLQRAFVRLAGQRACGSHQYTEGQKHNPPFRGHAAEATT